MYLFLENNNFRAEASEKHVQEMSVKEMLKANSHHNDDEKKWQMKFKTFIYFIEMRERLRQFGYHYTIAEGFRLA